MVGSRGGYRFAVGRGGGYSFVVGNGGGCGFASCSSKSLNEKKKEIDRKREKEAWKKKKK